MGNSFRAIFIFFLVCTAGTLSAAIPQSQRDALIAFYNATNGPAWTRNGGWLGAPGTECNWYGVECNSAQTTVTGLDLGYNNVSGPVHSSLASLPDLEKLDLTEDNLTGSIPPFLGSLTKLRILRLRQFEGGDLVGPIPVELMQLSQLQVLDLAANKITEPIPPGIFQLANLEELSLWFTGLSGELPAAAFHMPKLRRLQLEYNGFTGSIPSTIAATNLEFLNLEHNRLTGPIPAAIGQLTKLTDLVLNDNDLTGSIPPQIGNLTALQKLNLANNELSGDFPPQIANLTQLRDLNVGNNPITGSLPATIGQLVNIEELYAYFTNMGGELPASLFTLPKIEVLSLEDSRFDARNSTFTGNLADFGRLTNLDELRLGGNEFLGPIPPGLTSHPNLRILNLSDSPIGGTIPSHLRNMVKLDTFEIAGAGLTGAIPDELGDLPNLAVFDHSRNALTSIPSSIARLSKMRVWAGHSNAFTGSIPSAFGQITTLQFLRLDDNQFSGAIPPELFTLPALRTVELRANRLSGPIPPVDAMVNLVDLHLGSNDLTALPQGLSSLPKIEILRLSGNDIEGSIPSDLNQLTKLRVLDLGFNRVSGTVPDLSAMTSLRELKLTNNRLEGAFPPWLGNMTQLQQVTLSGNRFAGEIPSNVTQLTSTSSLTISYNALSSTNAGVRSFLTPRAGDWESTQTVPPADVRISASRERSLVVSWTPISFQRNSGGYTIFSASSPSGPFTALVTTPDKTASTFTLDGLVPSTDYFVQVRTVTYPSSDNQNVVVSEPSPVVSGRTSNGTPAPASVVVLLFPNGISQDAGVGGRTTRYVLANVGELPTTITLTQEGDFFTQSPTSFVLAGGASQSITITALPRPDGSYNGASVPSGDGVRAGMKIPIKLLSTTPPEGFVRAVADRNRIDVTATIEQTDLGGTVNFTNNGTATLRGIVVADVAWIKPPADLIVIPAGGTQRVDFAVDRTLRPDADALAGAQVGTLSLLYSTRAAAKTTFDAGSLAAQTPVTVVDTVKPPVNNVVFPPLNPGEVPLFLPGVGHVAGGGGRLFISDLSLINAFGVAPITDLKSYYTPAVGSPTSGTGVTNVNSLQPTQALSLADVVFSVYNGSNDQGTLQIRSRDWSKLFVNATLFNVSDPRGTFGTAIPVFRGDRAAGPGSSVFLTGLRQDATSRTNIFVQETAGSPAVFDTTFFDKDGAVIQVSGAASRSDNAEPFRLTRLINQVPPGAVSARLTNRSTSSGSIVAYATPVDDLSGDFWTVVDWNLHFASSRSERQIIPVAGLLRGANNNFFRTDVSLANRSSNESTGTLRLYYSGGASFADQSLTLKGGETRTINDVVGTLYPSLPSGTVGFMVFTPSNGEFTITSRTFATEDGINGTFGTGVPTVPDSLALRLGQSRLIAGLEVASAKSVGERRPATFRTNVGLVETSGAAVTVRVAIIYSDVKSGALASGTRLTTKSFELPPNGFLLTNVTNVIAETNPDVGDLRNVQVEIRVTGGNGAVIPFTSSVDNGTVDQIFRTE